MKIGLITDLHTTPEQNRSQSIIKSLDYISDYFKNDGIDTVINLGDFFDSTKITSYNEILVFNKYIDLFGQFKNIILMGNHELLEARNLDNSIWKSVSKVNNFNVIYDYMEKKIDNVWMGFLPYGVCISEQGHVSKTKLDMIFHHQDVIGMSYPSGKIIDAGGNKIDLSKNYSNLYIGGHIHVFQQYNNSIYLGATVHKSYDYIENFSLNKLPSFYVLDTDSKVIKSEYNPYSKVSLKYSDKDSIEKIHYDLDSILKVNPDYEVYIRFLYSGKEYDCFDIDKQVKKFFPKTAIEFFRKVNTMMPLISAPIENEVVLGKNLDESIRNFLKQKDSELIPIYERVK
jgi:DNA repair exonuclease SbcCD nuclease subunit